MCHSKVHIHGGVFIINDGGIGMNVFACEYWQRHCRFLFLNGPKDKPSSLGESSDNPINPMNDLSLSWFILAISSHGIVFIGFASSEMEETSNKSQRGQFTMRKMRKFSSNLENCRHYQYNKRGCPNMKDLTITAKVDLSRISPSRTFKNNNFACKQQPCWGKIAENYRRKFDLYHQLTVSPH